MGNEPESVTIKGRDLKPYHYALWCSTMGGEPFANTIDLIRWSDDGEYLWLMLDTHNFHKVGPDEDIEVIPLNPTGYYAKYADWTLPPRPIKVPPPLPSRDAVLAYLRSLPAGGIAEVVAEAKVAEWTDDLGPWQLFGDGELLGGVFGLRKGGIAGPVESYGARMTAERTRRPTTHPTEADARAWVEARAVEAGWTIARPKEVG